MLIKIKMNQNSINEVVSKLEDNDFKTKLKVSEDTIETTKKILNYMSTDIGDGEPENKNIEYIINLDKKFRDEHGVRSEVYGTGVAYDYADKKMTLKQMEKVLSIIEDENLIFYPINTSSGFAIGFQIVKPIELNEVAHPQIKHLFTFVERQLPEGYTFKKLSKTFMRKRNIDLIKLYTLREIVNDRDHYDY